MSSINFGTDGWRAEMGRDFTFDRVRIFAGAYSHYLNKKFKGEIRVIVNFDTRFLSSRYAEEAVKILSLRNIKAFIPERDTPIPAISYFVSQQNFHGALNFTAGVKSPIFNGIKILNDKGAPELKSETRKIEKIINERTGKENFKPQYAEINQLNNRRLRNSYLKYLEKTVDFDSIRVSGLKVIVDNLYGSSRDYLDYILNSKGIKTISIHNFPYSSFGNLKPDSTRESLSELSSLVLENKADIGLATDINGSRFGIIDSKGDFIEPEKILPPMIEYLIKERKMKGGVIKSVSATENIRNVAEHYLRKVHECPVGFKYLAEEMDKRKVFIAVEGSNGGTLNAGGKIKDGILFSLLISEMAAFYRMGLDEIIESFYSRFPKLYKNETSVCFDNVSEKKAGSVLNGDGLNFNGTNYKGVDFVDGIKIFFDNSWLLIRRSGTENVFRIYAESDRRKKSLSLIKLGRGLIEKRKK